MGGEVVEVEGAVPHSSVVDKNQEGYLGSELSQIQVTLHSPGFQYRKDKSAKLLAVKPSGGCGSGRNCQIFRRLCLKGPLDLILTQTHSLWVSPPG